MTEPTYIDAIAERILRGCDPLWHPNADEMALLRLYAVLALAKGEATTPEDVHDAWCAWAADVVPAHRSLKPFADLTPEVRALDEPYADAIRAVARELSHD